MIDYKIEKKVWEKWNRELIEIHKRCLVTHLTERGMRKRTQKKFFKLYDVYVTTKNIRQFFNRPLKIFIIALVKNCLDDISYEVNNKKSKKRKVCTTKKLKH